MARRPKRIRQTKTPFQEIIGEERLFSIGYWDALPEFLHLSIALVDNTEHRSSTGNITCES